MEGLASVWTTDRKLGTTGGWDRAGRSWEGAMGEMDICTNTLKYVETHNKMLEYIIIWV